MAQVVFAMTAVYHEMLHAPIPPAQPQALGIDTERCRWLGMPAP